MIAVVDYGMGNLRSVHKALEKVGYTACVTSSPLKIRDASAIVASSCVVPVLFRIRS